MEAGIAGAGIVGRLLAFSLLHAGWKVSLFDQDTKEGRKSCSGVAAGLLTPFSELDKSPTSVAKLGWVAIQQDWPEILSLLSCPVLLRKGGSLVVAHPRDQVEFPLFLRRLASRWSPECYQQLDKEALHQLEPALSRFQGACYFPEEASIDTQAVFQRLGHYLTEHGVEWHSNTPVQSVDSGQIVLNEGLFECDMAFDCRGLGGRASFEQLRGVRGELAIVSAPDVSLQHILRLLHPRISLYIVPCPPFRYIIGASEIESEDFSEISIRTLLELLTAAYSVHPGFGEARILATRTQCRPTLPHSIPQIKWKQNFLAINGLYRYGYLLSPTLVKDVMQFLKDGMGAVQYPEYWKEQ
ncbi:FAD-dependent oxidoreductase [Pajaroellobacter abortibovis]|uniref:FAD dependent oxidoreductase domain-containing protein n=1 Tax=Pajaroellobacter abortibovis TaxID=1882918 RepID=A0A1L6MWE1_9BACT|nr:FAD-dependent oxidoreductase [Pajaroellobacter abortibovis]APR99745.1 hypothetical protein BCY86_02940 [Pajaroellobacter abortibovis]